MKNKCKYKDHNNNCNERGRTIVRNVNEVNFGCITTNFIK